MRLTTTRSQNVGLLIDWLAPGYQGEILEGVKRAASQRGSNLLVFFGGALHEPSLASAHSSVYALATDPVVDGVVAVMGSLAPQVGPEAGAELLRSLAVPATSLGMDLDGFPSLCTDNAVGLRELCKHLIEVHGARHFAMIAGPTTSPDSEQRIAACREQLGEFHLELSESHVTHQDFRIQSGKAGIDDLFGTRKLNPDTIDAIMCGNDLMAEGALGALAERGIHVPEDVILTGFDGVDRGRYTHPPLSTVAQPLVDLGHESCRMLLDTLEGREVNPRVRLPSKPVIRASCGCVSRQDPREFDPGPIAAPHAGATNLLRHRDEIRVSLARAAEGRFGCAGAGWEERWLHSLFSDLSGSETTGFLAQLDSSLRRLGGERAPLEMCRRLLLELRALVLRHVGDPETCRRFEDIMHSAETMTRDALERLEVNQRLTMTGTLYNVLYSIERLLRLVARPRFWDQLAADLRQHGIHTCIVSRFVDEPSNSQIRLAFSDVEEGWDELKDKRYPTKDLLPANRVRHSREYPLVVRNLVHAERSLGMIIFSLSVEDVAIFEALASVVALQLAVESNINAKTSAHERESES